MNDIQIGEGHSMAKLSKVVDEACAHHQMIDAIARKVMGWHLETYSVRDKSFIWCLEDSHKQACQTFNPLTSDADCMMAWDRFNAGPTRNRVTSLTHNVSDGLWLCTVDGELTNKNKDRRRVMVECMAKAVSM